MLLILKWQFRQQIAKMVSLAKLLKNAMFSNNWPGV